MHFAYLLTFRDPRSATKISEDDHAGILEIVRSTPRLRRAHIHTPSTSKDFYIDDGPSPTLALQLDFATLSDLEATLTVNGHLQAMANGRWASLENCAVEQQAMAVRPFATPNPQFETDPSTLPCSYLVHYPGEAENFGEWINYYLSHHPQIMTRFDGIREIEIFTRVDWLDALPWTRVHYMQRNKLVFDSPEALTAANFSDVRHEMRKDFEAFPAFTGGNLHYAMRTLTLP